MSSKLICALTMFAVAIKKLAYLKMPNNNKLAKVFLTELLEFLKSLKWNNDWFYCENTRLLANIHIENNEISKSEELLLETIGIYRKNNEKSVYYSSTLIAYSRLLGSKSNYFLQEIKLIQNISFIIIRAIYFKSISYRIAYKIYTIYYFM